jgi:hypothetical protein
MRRIRLLAYAILDGTLIPIDRVADQKPYYCGKHKRHSVNVQVIADALGRLGWASAALPGASHDLGVVFDSEWEDWSKLDAGLPQIADHTRRRLRQPLLWRSGHRY